MADHDDSQLAPPNRAWHLRYVKISLRVSELFNELQNDSSFKDAEDLGDWVEAMATLNTFRPLTQSDIELQGRKELGLA